VYKKISKKLISYLFFIILSIRPYLSASSADIKLSLSQSFSTSSTVLPECLAKILYKVFPVLTICSAARTISVA